MKAARLTKKRKLEIHEIPEPGPLAEDQVLLKIEAVGICGSDIHYYHDGRIGDQVVEYPFIIGHECSGIIADVGKNITHLKPGMRVAVDPSVSCGKCLQCRAGRPHTCLNLRFLGCPGQLQGCLTEYLVMPAKNCFPMEKNISPALGVLAEPLSIGIYALSLMEDPTSERIGILGSGPIGLCVAAAAQTTGKKSIYMTDKIDDRLIAAQRAGAKWAGNPNKEDIVQAISSQETTLLDAVFECCGDQEALDQAIDLLKPGGQLLIVGIPPADRIFFDIHKLRRKEIRISNVRRQKKKSEAALKFIREHSSIIDFMLTHSYGLEDIETAFELVADYKDGVIKAIIQMS